MKRIQYTILKASVIFILAAVNVLNAQQEPQFSQYLDNQLYLNPAYAGSRGTLNIGGLYRQQWTGYRGAPMTQSLFIHSPLKYESVGIGGTIINDRVGPLNQTWINVDFSYSLKFNNGGKLAFGLKGGMNLVNGSFSELHTTTEGDPTMMMNYANRVMPNFGFGMMYHSERWFAGVSIPKIVQHGAELDLNIMLERRHYYILAGGYFDLSSNVKLRPSTLIKLTDNAPFSWDMTMAFIVNDKWWFGANYRLMESAGGFVQMQISEKFKVGYSFDISTSALVRHNYGTHELMLGYDLMLNKEKALAPRYF